MDTRTSFISSLELPDLDTHVRSLGLGAKAFKLRAAPEPDKPTATLIKGQVTAFSAGLQSQDKQDVEYTTLAAQLNSDVMVKDNQTLQGMQDWFKNYASVMSNLGWIMSFEWEKYNASSAGLSVDKVILEVISAIATQNGMAIAKAAMDAVSKLPQDDGRLKLFSNSTMGASAGKFLLGTCTKEGNDSIALCFGAFAMDYKTRDTSVLWFNWKSSDVNMYKDQKIATFNQKYYATGARSALEAKMAGHAESYVADLDLGF